MAANIQRRGARFQLRVTHPLLHRAFFHTFPDHASAATYGEQLMALLERGIVPAELAEPAKQPPGRSVTAIVCDFRRHASHLTASDDALLGAMLTELADLRVRDITFAWAETYIRDLKVKRNLAPGTIRKRVGALARVLDWHHARNAAPGEVWANPLRALPVGYSQYTRNDAAALDEGAKVRQDVRRDRRLLPGEADKIRACMDEDLRLMFDVIVHTGLRLREAYRLRVDQIDTEKHVIRVEGTKGARGLIKPRVVPVVPALRPALKKRVEGRVGLLWPYWDGKPETMRPVTARLSYLFAKAFRAAGIKDLTEHDLRHEATCRWFEHRSGRGWTFADVEIARIMGWSNLAMALRYASLRGEDLAARLY